MADVVIAGVVLLAAYWGLRRGLIRPLVVEGIFVLALIFTTRYHDVLVKIVPSAIPSFAVTTVAIMLISLVVWLLARPLVSLIRAIPFVRPVDTAAGLLVHAALAFLVVYLAIGAVLDFDRHVYPWLAAGSATARQIDDYRQAIESDPLLSSFVDTARLRELQKNSSGVLIPRAQIEQFDNFLKLYTRYIHNPLADSHLGPIVNSLGARLPVIGRERPYLAPAVPPPSS